MENTLLKKVVALTAALTVVLLLISACGGDDDDVQSTVTTQATASPTGNEPTDEPDDGVEETPEATPEETDDNGGSGEGPNACELLTTDEIAEEVGTDVAEGQQIDAAPYHSCTWFSDGYTANLDLISGTPSELADYFEGSGGETEQEIEGLGEAARWTIDTELLVVQGDYLVVLLVSSVNFEESALGPTTDLMEKVLDRLS